LNLRWARPKPGSLNLLTGEAMNDGDLANQSSLRPGQLPVRWGSSTPAVCSLLSRERYTVRSRISDPVDVTFSGPSRIRVQSPVDLFALRAVDHAWARTPETWIPRNADQELPKSTVRTRRASMAADVVRFQVALTIPSFERAPRP